tara:strand:- start:525 stop:698 length:174 start_codon:yes stop_codon:yes gene_type:complete
MKKFFLILLLLNCCSINETELKKDLPNINFSDDLSLDEFKVKLKEYANINPYPSVDD